jgi:HemX protein
MPNFNDRFWLWCAGACYLTGLVLGTVAVLRERKQSRGLMYLIVVAGYLFQTTGLYLRGLEVKGCPIGNQFEIFQFTGWSATTLYLVIGATFRLSLLGYFTSMLSAALALVSLSMPAWDLTRRVNIFGGNAWIEFHAALALFSYGVFALLALTSILFLLRHFSLKNKRLDGAFAFLPPIVDLDHISFRLHVAGVLLLAASLCVGALWWLRAVETVHSVKIVATAAIWMAYAIALGLRLRGVLLAKRLAWVCVALFVAALLSLSTVSSRSSELPTSHAFHSSP